MFVYSVNFINSFNFIFISDALRQDVENFSGVNIKYKIVGNTIDCNIFKDLNKDNWNVNEYHRDINRRKDR